MPLRGDGFLAIWNDTNDADDAEWCRWHTFEHMPERVSVPGFTAGRRFSDPGRATHRYFTLYEGATLATFSSAAYRQRLDNPTPWTRRTGPYFRNFVRGACGVIVSEGIGVGGTMATLRLTRADAQASLDPERCRALARAITSVEGFTAVHIGSADLAVTRVPTSERDLRTAGADQAFDSVLMAEGYGRAPVEAGMARVVGLVAAAGLGVTVTETAVYDLVFALDKPALGLA